MCQTKHHLLLGTCLNLLRVISLIVLVLTLTFIKGRIPPRTPCGDLQVVTQVVEVQGERLDLKKTV